MLLIEVALYWVGLFLYTLHSLIELPSQQAQMVTSLLHDPSGGAMIVAMLFTGSVLMTGWDAFSGACRRTLPYLAKRTLIYMLIFTSIPFILGYVVFGFFLFLQVIFGPVLVVAVLYTTITALAGRIDASRRSRRLARRQWRPPEVTP